jgi:hypothetical protein
MLVAARGVPTDAREAITSDTESEGSSIWADELEGRSASRLQTRALVEGARATVDATGVVLRSGGSLSVVGNPAEHGGNPSYLVATTSSRGKPYKRRFGNAFGAPSKRGKVVDPAVSASVERFTLLWVEAAKRAVRTAFNLEGK